LFRNVKRKRSIYTTASANIMRTWPLK